MSSIIETYGYARAGFLGNPSDGYFGKTISFSIMDFRARVLLYPSARLEIKPSKADLPIFENLEDLHRTTRWRGYYGGIRIIQALLVRFMEYCREQGIALVGGGADEAPDVYKRLPDVLAAHGETIRVKHTLRPLGVAMAGRDVYDPYKD